jgi:hypothetical protein
MGTFEPSSSARRLLQRDAEQSMVSPSIRNAPDEIDATVVEVRRLV